MASVSKKEYLEKKYIEFSNDIGKILKVDLFPSLDELCMIDILLVFGIGLLIFAIFSILDMEQEDRVYDPKGIVMKGDEHKNE